MQCDSQTRRLGPSAYSLPPLMVMAGGFQYGIRWKAQLPVQRGRLVGELPPLGLLVAFPVGYPMYQGFKGGASPLISPPGFLFPPGFKKCLSAAADVTCRS